MRMSALRFRAKQRKKIVWSTKKETDLGGSGPRSCGLESLLDVVLWLRFHLRCLCSGYGVTILEEVLTSSKDLMQIGMIAGRHPEVVSMEHMVNIRISGSNKEVGP
jgi:hypothetical protein